uniref:DUF1737 domain-containing protein n=1 Tax=Escherichia coli TaxID=562 RepID=A0A6M9WSL8_ECOLX|nr:DUF1737 domain-containing protein [Escherichia coli]
MAFKHYDVVRASSPSDLAGKLTQKLKEGWQPYGSPIISNAGYGYYRKCGNLPCAD